jgi:hypothetical protein
LPTGSKEASVKGMSKKTAELLEAFDALPVEEKQSFTVEILKRTRELPLDSGPLADEEIGEAGKALFGFLDREENAAGTR